MKLFFIVVYLFSVTFIQAQTALQLDSLEHLLINESGRRKIDLLNEYAYQHTQVDNNWNKVDSLAGLALKLSEADKYDKGIADAYFSLSYVKANVHNNLDIAMDYLFRAEKIYLIQRDHPRLGLTYKMIGYYSKERT